MLALTFDFHETKIKTEIIERVFEENFSQTEKGKWETLILRKTGQS